MRRGFTDSSVDRSPTLESDPMPTLTTKRLLLRQWQDTDLGPFQELSADPDVMTYIGCGRPRSAQEAEQSLNGFVLRWVQQGYGLFAIELLQDGSFVGMCGLSKPTFLPQLLPEIELGWRLKKDHWGRGLGSEAAEAVTQWAFDCLQIERLVSVIHTDNRPSHRLAQGIGMNYSHSTVLPKSETPVAIYTLERTSWVETINHGQGHA